MTIQEGEFRLHRMSTKRRGRPTIRKSRPLTATERQRRWRKNKTAKAQRIAQRKARDEANRAASEAARAAGVSCVVHHIGIDEMNALLELRSADPDEYKRVRSGAASLYEAGREARRIIGPVRDTYAFNTVKRLWPKLTPEERAELARKGED